MRESVTYQAILEEGRVEWEARGRAEGERRLLLLLGEQKLGPAPSAIRARLEAIDQVERLEDLGRRLLSAPSWEALLGPA